MRTILLMSILCLGGCAALREDLSEPLPPGLAVAEGVYQASTWVDVAQTIKGPVEDRCYAETDQITRAFTGSHPKTQALVGYRIGYDVTHLLVARWLSANDHPYVAWALEALTIGDEGYAIKQNYAVGIRLGAPNVHPAPCDPATGLRPAAAH
jgi:hypothetical protein